MFRVYVGNLPYSARDADLKDFFEKAGCKVTESMVVMMPDGRSKGFGFVSFEDEDSFKKAQGLSGTDMQGRQVRIDAARPKEDRGDRPMGGDAPMAKPAEKTDNEDKDDDKADAMMDKASDDEAPSSDAATDSDDEKDGDDSDDAEDK